MFKIVFKYIKEIAKSFFTEGEGNLSIGSLCVFTLIMSYIGCMIYAQITGIPIVISAGDISILAGTIYGVKKLETAAEYISDNNKNKDGC